MATQHAFATAHPLGHPLLPAPGHRVARHLGAYRRWLPGGLHTRRMTFVIDTDRRIRHVVADERSMQAHADAALQVLRREAAA